MKTSSLFEEAIADARAVRATALANARIILEESFTPRLKSMLSAKLKEELGEDEDLGVVVPDEGMGVSAGDDVVTSEEIDQILKELDGDVDDSAPGPEAAADVSAPVPTADDSVPSVAPAAPAVTAVTGLGDVKTVEAPALVVAPGQLPIAGGAVADSVPTEPDAAVVGDPSEEPSEDDEEINLDELLAELSDVSGDVDDSSCSEEEMQLDEKKKPSAAQKAAQDEFKKKFTESEGKLGEAIETIEFLRTQLNEVNLLNAKLLYTNRIFKAHALNGTEKMKIIESFDLAKSVREVKLTFNNLSEALSFGKAKAPIAKKAITEGFSSQSVGTTKPVEKIVLAPVSEMASRFQKLAGIKK